MDDQSYTEFLAFWGGVSVRANKVWTRVLGLVSLGLLLLWKLAQALYHVAAAFARRGWRVVLPWVFLYAVSGLAYRMAHGLPMPDVAAIVGVLAPLAGSTIVAQITRSIEVRSGVSQGGSVMDTIGGIFSNVFAPGVNADGAPRPVAPA